MERWSARALRPVDAASLVVARATFGALLFVATVRFWHAGWIAEHFLGPTRFFTYWGFGWVRPLPGLGMYVVYAAMALAALALALGAATRAAAIVFTLLFSYAHLCDATHYLNHYVLVSLLGALFAVLPVGRWGSVDAWVARRRGRSPAALVAPAWWVWLVRFQIGVVYFFGGVGKLNGDWLLRAEPLRTWLARATDVPLLGPLGAGPSLAFGMSWAGVVFDLSVPFLLLHRRTRLLAYLAACGFHLVTGRLFQLGLFPWLMVALVPIFFSPSWPRDLARRLRGPAALGAAPRSASAPFAAWSASTPFALALAGAFVLAQVLVPLRGLVYPGNGLWTEQGFRFAWKVMLVEKNGDVVARVTDRSTGRVSIVRPSELFDPYQTRMMATQPDLLLQFAHAVRDLERARGRDVEVRLDAFVALNGRRSQRFVDPDVDLAREEEGWAPKGWIVPLGVVKPAEKIHEGGQRCLPGNDPERNGRLPSRDPPTTVRSAEPSAAQNPRKDQTTMHARNTLFAALAVATLSLTACEDPAATAPKATVGSAKPVTTASAKATAKATATAAASAAPAESAAAPAPSGSAAAAAAAPAKPEGALDLLPATSKVEWTGSKVTGKHDGKFEKFTGWLALEGDKPETAKIFVDIELASVKSDSEKLDGHLKSDDFFSADKFPSATFVSTEIKAGGDKGATHTITGNLKMRGVEKSVSFPATVKVDAKEVSAKAEFAINRKDWGIVYEGKKDDLIREDVVIKLDIKAARPAK